MPGFRLRPQSLPGAIGPSRKDDEMPSTLYIISWISILLGIACAAIVALDILSGHRQKMWIMDLVWPITALYSGPLGLAFYYSRGRQSRKDMQSMRGHESHSMQPADARMNPGMRHQGHMSGAMEHGHMSTGSGRPFWEAAAVAATHCGAGCTLGDIIAEWFVFFVPFSLFGMTLFGAWAIDYILAFIFGIAFQYFTITPMKNLSPKEGLIAALKADALTLTAWQVGMYGWMAIVTFVIFGYQLKPNDPVFWFMMQIAMVAGFLTSYPVNCWLLAVGIKEKM
jgi:Domain of unknown function (DUF4396)